jgi:hypothetical protein
VPPTHCRRLHRAKRREVEPATHFRDPRFVSFNWPCCLPLDRSLRFKPIALRYAAPLA